MRLSTIHAISIMTALALRTAPARMTDIAEEIDISTAYAEVILKKLVQAKLVVGKRGPGGGYLLAGNGTAWEIAGVTAVSEVVWAMEGDETRGDIVNRTWFAVLQNLEALTVQDVARVVWKRRPT
jgi:Rrf2 family protein